MAGVAGIHHPLRDVDAVAGDDRVAGHVQQAVDRSRMDPMPEFQVRRFVLDRARDAQRRSRRATPGFQRRRAAMPSPAWRRISSSGCGACWNSGVCLTMAPSLPDPARLLVDRVVVNPTISRNRTCAVSSCCGFRASSEPDSLPRLQKVRAAGDDPPRIMISTPSRFRQRSARSALARSMVMVVGAPVVGPHLAAPAERLPRAGLNHLAGTHRRESAARCNGLVPPLQDRSKFRAEERRCFAARARCRR